MSLSNDHNTTRSTINAKINEPHDTAAQPSPARWTLCPSVHWYGLLHYWAFVCMLLNLLMGFTVIICCKYSQSNYDNIYLFIIYYYYFLGGNYENLDGENDYSLETFSQKMKINKKIWKVDLVPCIPNTVGPIMPISWYGSMLFN